MREEIKEESLKILGKLAPGFTWRIDHEWMVRGRLETHVGGYVYDLEPSTKFDSLAECSPDAIVPVRRIEPTTFAAGLAWRFDELFLATDEGAIMWHSVLHPDEPPLPVVTLRAEVCEMFCFSVGRACREVDDLAARPQTQKTPPGRNREGAKGNDENYRRNDGCDNCRLAQTARSGPPVCESIAREIRRRRRLQAARRRTRTA